MLSSLPTRRSLFLGMLAAATQGSDAAAQQVAGGVRLISPAESEFDSRVSSSYAGITTLELYPQIKQFMAILAHEGEVPATAYSVVWILQEESGRQRTMHAHYIGKHDMPENAVRNLTPGSLSSYFALLQCNAD